MPYIDQKRRQHIDRMIEDIYLSDAGSMNYCIIRLINNYCKINKLSYKTINDAIGILECVKQEFYRRVGSVLEDKKANKNGDLEWPR